MKFLAPCRILLAAGVILGGMSTVTRPPLQAAESIVSLTAIEFSLPTANGDNVSLSSDTDVRWHVLCFLGTECPLARVYGPRLQEMSDRFASRGVRFIGINSNVQDSMDDVRRYVAEHGIRFPVAKDYDRDVALSMKATRTPEVVVIDRGGVVRYRGRIDDQYQPGIARAEATRHDLRDAIEQLVAGEPVKNPHTEAVGCLISLPAPSDSPASDDGVTFCDQVIRVFQRNCLDCHRSGEIGPFVLDQYDEVIGWADMCLEVIDQGRMPPWHASPEYGEFVNARQMTDSDKAILRSWVDSGMPYGNSKDLPTLVDAVPGWRLPRQPDAVFQMREEAFEIPAQGTVEYQYFVVDPGFVEDRWVSAVEVIPGNSAVVHHCIAFTRPPDGSDFRDIGLLSAYVPGQRSGIFPEGFVRRIPARSKIIFQMHYTPTGKPETDNTRIGLVFANPKDVTHEVFALGGIEQEFEIPPHEASQTVSGSIGWFPKDGFLLSIMPHMHLRGKSYRMFAETERGTETLLSVPQYDFNWQHNYEFTEPLALAAIRSLGFEVTFDNSSGNPTNPDPEAFVTWGDQTWQEMAVTFIEVARPIESEQRPAMSEALSEQRRRKELKERMARADAFAAQYIARFDTNGDGWLAEHELPEAVRKYGHFDHNRDGHVSHQELSDEALERFDRAK